MIFKKLKYNSVSRRLKKLIAERTLSTSNKKISNLLVVVDIDKYENIDSFKTLAESLNLTPENCKILPFSANKKTIKANTGLLLTNNKIGWKGVIKDKEIKALLATEIDLLINFFDSNSITLGLVSASANANFKVGFSSVNNALNDLIIDCELSNFKLFKTEMMKYLKVLNKL